MSNVDKFIPSCLIVLINHVQYQVSKQKLHCRIMKHYDVQKRFNPVVLTHSLARVKVPS